MGDCNYAAMLARIIKGLSGSAVQAASQFLILSVIARTGGAPAVGEYAYVLAIAAPVALISSFGLRHIVATDISGNYSFTTYLQVRLLGSSIVVVAVPLIVIALGNADLVGISLLLGCVKAIELNADLMFGLRYRNEKFGIANAALCIRSLLGALALTAALLFSNNLVYGIGALCATGIIAHIAFDYSMYCRSPQNSHFNLKNTIPLIKTGLIFSSSLALAALTTSIPRLILGNNQGSDILGSFALLAYLVSAGAILVNSVGQTLSPRYASLASDKNKKGFISLLLSSFWLISVAAIGALFIIKTSGTEILSTLYGKEAAEVASPYFHLVIIAAAFFYASSLANSAINGLRAFKWYLPITSFTVIIATILSISMIPEGGSSSIYWVWILTCFSQLAMTTLVLAKVIRGTSWA